MTKSDVVTRMFQMGIDPSNIRVVQSILDHPGYEEWLAPFNELRESDDDYELVCDSIIAGIVLGVGLTYNSMKPDVCRLETIKRIISKISHN